MSAFTESDIMFGRSAHAAIEVGGFELLGSDETLAVGNKVYRGPGTVTVWRWKGGGRASQIERPNGELEAGAFIEVAA